MGKRKCNKCGEPHGPRWPVKNEDGSWNWANMFKMDAYSIILIVLVIALIGGYKVDMAECINIMESPKTYCDNYCKGVDVFFGQQNKEFTMDIVNLSDYMVNETG